MPAVFAELHRKRRALELANLALEKEVAERRLAEIRLGELNETLDRRVTERTLAPTSAGIYFNKIQCFCFTKQTLKPGQTVDFPVQFFVDPAILEDLDTKSVSEITLSYSFYPTAPDQQASLKKN